MSSAVCSKYLFLFYIKRRVLTIFFFLLSPHACFCLQLCSVSSLTYLTSFSGQLVALMQSPDDGMFNGSLGKDSLIALCWFCWNRISDDFSNGLGYKGLTRAPWSVVKRSVCLRLHRIIVRKFSDAFG